MDNPEKSATHGIQDTGRRQINKPHNICWIPLDANKYIWI